jgi:hypothetical protein
MITHTDNTKFTNGNPVFKDCITESLSDQMIPKLDYIMTYLHSKNKNENVANLDKILLGGLIKLAFLGRFNSNSKLLSCFFLNEPNVDNIDLFSHTELHKYSVCSKDTSKLNVSSTYSFFSNLNNLSFFGNYFPVYHKASSFNKDIEFKTDLFSNHYENCIELDLEEFNQLMTLLCNNDIVIYTTNKINENLHLEAKYFEYIIRRFPIFKDYINNGKFFIVLNTYQNDANMFYYENEEARIIFERLNSMFDNKLIYELDVENSRIEKIIYFSKMFQNKNFFFEENENVNYIVRNFYKNYDQCKNLNILSRNYEKTLQRKFRLSYSKNFDYNDEYLKTEKYENFVNHFNQTLENYYSFDLNKIKEFDKAIYESILKQIDAKLDLTIREIYLDEFSRSTEVTRNGRGPENLSSSYIIMKQNLENMINQSFDFLAKEISKEILYFMRKFKTFNEKIENIKKITSENKSFKGELIYKNKLQFLYEVFDIYGLKHYFTLLSIEAIYIYYHNFKKLFLNFMKLNSMIHTNLDYLNSNIVSFYEELRLETQNNMNNKLANFNTESYLKAKLNNYQFFNLLLFKVFAISSTSMKYQPVFAYYNVSNLAAGIVAVVFFLKGLKKYLKFKPNYRKILRYLFTGVFSIIVTYIGSCLLNNYYNRKSERKFFCMLEQIKMNLRQIMMQLSMMNSEIEEFRKVYLKNALMLLNKLNI